MEDLQHEYDWDHLPWVVVLIDCSGVDQTILHKDLLNTLSVVVAVDLGDDEKVVGSMVVENLVAAVDAAWWSCDGGLRSFYGELRSHQPRILVNYHLTLTNYVHSLLTAPVTKKKIFI